MSEYQEYKKIRFIEKIERTIGLYNMISGGDSVLAGVSGGADSVALLRALIFLRDKLSFSIGVAHLNHNLRGAESERDAVFVEKLSERFGLPFYMDSVDVISYRKDHGLSMEEAARRLRYSFYERTAFKEGYSRIALGHHMDDNAELILMYLFRGSGTLGLSGIPPVRNGRIIRPLICSSRIEIQAFLEETGETYVTDSSNRDTKILRNRIRCDLLPLLKENFNPNITGALNRLGEITRCEEEWLEGLTEPLFNDCIIEKSIGKIELSVSMLRKNHSALNRRIFRKSIQYIKGDLRKISLSHIDSICGFLGKDNGFYSLDLPDMIRVQLKEGRIVFRREAESLRVLPVIPAGEEELYDFQCIINEPADFGEELVVAGERGFNLKLTSLKKESVKLNASGRDIAFFDIDNLDFPLEFRNIRVGDRFSPIGMNGTKKVKKYLIDSKVPRKDRKKCCVLVSGNEIIWLVGHRQASLSMVKSDTVNVLKVEKI